MRPDRDDPGGAAIEEALDIIAFRLAPAGTPLARDRDPLLRAFINVLAARSERLYDHVFAWDLLIDIAAIGYEDITGLTWRYRETMTGGSSYQGRYNLHHPEPIVP